MEVHRELGFGFLEAVIPVQFKRLVRTASENLRKSAKSADNVEEIVL